jgi:myo-inositol-1(or 4)-monophosphatase
VPIRVSAVDRLDHALLVTGFPYDRHTAKENNFAQFVALKKQAQGIRRFGSAALDLAFTAAGSFDGYWEMRLNAWDVAAGILLVEEAGGLVSDWRGEAVSLSRCEVLATNGQIHQAVSTVLKNTPHGAMG